MSIDDLGRAAATDARRKSALDVDPTAMLTDLHRTHRTRTLGTILAAAVVVVVGAAVVLVGARVASHTHSANPAARPSPTPSASALCSGLPITCLGAQRYRVALTVPVTVTLPTNFGAGFRLFGNGAVEDYRNDADSTGVTVMENAIPVKYDASWTQDPAAGTTAASMATWLWKRPFLVHATLTRASIGGRIAWRVTASVQPGARLPATHGTGLVAPTFTDISGSTREGYSQALIGQFTLLDVPGGGVTVIWSWTVNNSSNALAGNLAYVEGLSFG
jgi:hypothetical protein